MATIDEIYTKAKDLWKSIMEFRKTKGAIWVVLCSGFGVGGWYMEDIKRHAVNIDSIPDIHAKLDTVDMELDTMKIIKTDFRDMHKSYQTDTAEFRSKMRPVLLAMDTLPTMIEKAKELENFVLENREYIIQLYDRVIIIEDRNN